MNRSNRLRLLVAPFVVAVTQGNAAEPTPPDATYRPLPSDPFPVTRAADEKVKPEKPINFGRRWARRNFSSKHAGD